ncbi:DegV family protein [Olsenella sp. YH-ols2217]|uniref:DegV family protein n=1 Tax=Kribbibacterium absianum TaxID=3044210 RepID=A0ABT6ZLH2_9ACTN|nr:MULTISPECIES: DegV family protein [unclassified Olsenella]MDJ1121724.1 DegV family protein [Olsenella sp. YH-ols2216]MDJ1129732.1 DegV family protein [Olsenella sp. YH-ols2217]
MNKQKIAVITDSGTNVPHAFVEQYDVRIVPLLINYSDGTYQSEVDITSDEVVKRMETEVPTTSLPSPSTILAALEQARSDGYEKAVCVTISSGLSATNQTCHLVANQIKDFPVEVIDTKSIGVAAGMVVMDAALLIEAGVPFEELSGRLNALAEQTWVIFSVDDLTYLRKGGRISEAQYRLGSALNIKPIFDCDDDGRYRTVKRCRGRAKALKAMVDMIAERSHLYDSVVCAVATAGKDRPERFASELKEKVGDLAGLITSRITPDLLVHTGPTLIGMAVQPCVPEMREWLAAQPA